MEKARNSRIHGAWVYITPGGCELKTRAEVRRAKWSDELHVLVALSHRIHLPPSDAAMQAEQIHEEGRAHDPKPPPPGTPQKHAERTYPKVRLIMSRGGANAYDDTNTICVTRPRKPNQKSAARIADEAARAIEMLARGAAAAQMETKRTVASPTSKHNSSAVKRKGTAADERKERRRTT